MEIIKKIKRKEFNDKNCLVYEYGLKERSINGALAKISGRYPQNGVSTNLKSKEMAYVLNGSGKVVINGKSKKINSGDLILINKKEKFY